MGAAADFAARDRELARTFAAAAERTGVRRLVYLGGLHPGGARFPRTWPHGSRSVRSCWIRAVPTAVLQAAVVIGSGSASFDMLRYLAGRLPAMVAPKWLRSRIQPIAVGDVLRSWWARRACPTT